MRSKAIAIVCPLITLFFVLGLWLTYLDLFDVPDYILPTPVSVLETLYSAFTEGFIYPHLLFTLKSMVVGYFFGCLSGLILGSLVAESRTFERFVYPYVRLIQSMPKVALAPLIIVWFGFGI